MATATDERTSERTNDFVLVRADRESQQTPVLHVRLKDGGLALADMRDVERVCAAAVHDKAQDGIEPTDEYVARCLLVTDKALRVTGSYRYPAKYLKQSSLTERAAWRSEMERQAERVAYHTLGKEASEAVVVQRFITWIEPL